MMDKSKPTNRRDFLKRTAALCGTAALSSTVVGVIFPDHLEAKTEPYDWSKHRWVYVIDTRKCIGCGSCVHACRVENKVPKGMYRTWIERYAIRPNPEEEWKSKTEIDSPDGGEHGLEPVTGHAHVPKSFFVPKMCNHCANTPCTQVCPVGASFSTHDGVVLVDDKQCIGCGYCVQACPYGSRYIHPKSHTADKCTWCYHRITKGKTTACAAACPAGARLFGDRHDPDDPINEILATKRVHVLQPQLLTEPQCFYLGLDMEVR